MAVATRPQVRVPLFPGSNHSRKAALRSGASSAWQGSMSGDGVASLHIQMSGSGMAGGQPPLNERVSGGCLAGLAEHLAPSQVRTTKHRRSHRSYQVLTKDWGRRHGGLRVPRSLRSSGPPAECSSTVTYLRWKHLQLPNHKSRAPPPLQKKSSRRGSNPPPHAMASDLALP